jgi:hypothetical protein
MCVAAIYQDAANLLHYLGGIPDMLEHRIALNPLKNT